MNSRLYQVTQSFRKTHIVRMIIFLLVITFLCYGKSSAQTHARQTHKKRFDSTSLAIPDTLTTGDYLSEIEKVFQIFNNVPVALSSFSELDNIASGLKNNDSALSLIKKRLSKGDRTVNLQNLQMFSNLLEELKTKTNRYTAQLNVYDTSMDKLSSTVIKLRQDSILFLILSNPALTDSFDTQLQNLNEKKLLSDSLIKQKATFLNNLRVHSSANIIAIDELLLNVNTRLKTANLKVFGKERAYLWEMSETNEKPEEIEIKNMQGNEWKIASFYFMNIKNNRYVLLIIGIGFFIWISYNLSSLKHLDRLKAIDEFKFNCIIPFKLLTTCILVLTLAPLYDLDAPVIYTEMIEILLLIALTRYYYYRLSRPVFYHWCIFSLLFLALLLIRWLNLSVEEQRWGIFIINTAAVLFGLYILIFDFKKHKEANTVNAILPLGILYILFNFLAAICNLFGRYTLTQLFYSTGIYACTTALALFIFSKAFTEAFLLQIKSSRIRKKYPEKFEWQGIQKGLLAILYGLAFIMWLVQFTDNLNIYDGINDFFSSLMTNPIILGNFSFTIGGILLFITIIWVSNFLQKYIAFFFGDTGDETWDDNKGQRSRLLITRLLLLVIGFLLAVAASGLAMDRITVILGALGIGIGMGLQGLVNSLVSGVILIFDRTIRIGDIVQISDKKGRVKEINVRASTLLTDEGAEIIIPNGDILSHNIINYTLSNNNIRTSIQVTVLKPFDSEELIAMVKEIVKSNKNVFIQKEPTVIITGITSKSAVIKVSFWCKDINDTEDTESVITKGICEHLEANGIMLL